MHYINSNTPIILFILIFHDQFLTISADYRSIRIKLHLDFNRTFGESSNVSHLRMLCSVKNNDVFYRSYELHYRPSLWLLIHQYKLVTFISWTLRSSSLCVLHTSIQRGALLFRVTSQTCFLWSYPAQVIDLMLHWFNIKSVIFASYLVTFWSEGLDVYK